MVFRKKEIIVSLAAMPRSPYIGPFLGRMVAKETRLSGDQIFISGS